MGMSFVMSFKSYALKPQNMVGHVTFYCRSDLQFGLPVGKYHTFSKCGLGDDNYALIEGSNMILYSLTFAWLREKS